MLKLNKIISIGLSVLLVGSLSLIPVTAAAGRDRSPIHWNKGKVTVIKKPGQYGAHPYDKWGRKVVVAPYNRHYGNRGRDVIVAPRNRHYRGIHIVRHHGRPYFGYGFYATDRDAFKWLAFTAISLKVLDNLNEDQQRLHESAQINATQADVGETIMWEDIGAAGSVTTVRKGETTTGQQCREFRQSVTIGDKTEQAYGTACLKADGSWQIVK